MYDVTWSTKLNYPHYMIYALSTEPISAGAPHV